MSQTAPEAAQARTLRTAIGHMLLIPAACAAAAAWAAATLGDPAAQSITAEDLLQARSLGPSVFSNDGRFAAVATIDGPANIGDSSPEDPALAGQRIHIVDVQAGRVRELGRPVAGILVLPPGQPWRRDAEFLSLLEVGDDGLGYVLWSRRSDKLQRLAGRAGSAYGWVGPHFVYSRRGEQAPNPMLRRQLLKRLGERWSRAWQADAPEVTVLDTSGTFPARDAAAGALMLAGPGKEAAVVARGDYLALIPAPDGRRFAAIRRTEEGRRGQAARRGALELFALTEGGARRLWELVGTEVAAGAISWSPDGTRLLLGATRSQSESELRLMIVNAKDGSASALASGGLVLRTPDVGALNPFLPLGWLGETPVTIAGAAGPENGAKDAPLPTTLDYGNAAGLRYDLYTLDAKGARNLTRFSKEGASDFVARRSGDGLVVADGRLWRVLPAAGAEPSAFPLPRPVIGFALERRYPPPSAETAYSSDERGERVALLVPDGSSAVRAVADLGSGGLSDPQPVSGWEASAANQQTTLTRRQRGWSSTLVLNTQTGSRPILEINPDLRGREAAIPERFSYRVRDRELTGWILRPTTSQAGGAPPAILAVYGGAVFGSEPPPFALPRAELPVFSGQALAAQGYAVIYPSLPLAPGSDHDIPALLTEAAEAATAELASRGLIDGQRVGLLGQSFGGFSVAAILGRSTRFRAGVSLAGVYDWGAAYGSNSITARLVDDASPSVEEMGMVESGQAQLGGAPWEKEEAFQRNSPIYQVDQISAPLLMLHGDLDLATTGLAGAERMYNAMRRSGKQAALVTYWGQGHVASSRSAARDQWQRVLTWFGRHLRGSSGQ